MRRQMKTATISTSLAAMQDQERKRLKDTLAASHLRGQMSGAMPKQTPGLDVGSYPDNNVLPVTLR